MINLADTGANMSMFSSGQLAMECDKYIHVQSQDDCSKGSTHRDGGRESVEEFFECHHRSEAHHEWRHPPLSSTFELAY